MKRLSSILFCVVASIATAGTGLAQTSSIQAKVPFTFAAGRTWLPAGSYVVTQVSPQEISIQNAATRRVVALSFIQPENLATVGSGSLVFHKYGQRYFLSGITCPPSATTAALPTSPLEQRAQERQKEDMDVIMVGFQR
ncbi:MAG TPA: hypothetical protein VMD92_10655 [Acidobacteriaceae bacterium]|nr:hypothetical protein [Acidobacteriaceae bacterium]